jgi:hypothetical protein
MKNNIFFKILLISSGSSNDFSSDIVSKMIQIKTQ